MIHDGIRGDFEKLQKIIAEGPLASNVAPEEIRHHLSTHYAFQEPIALDAVVADVEQMLRNWQVQITHPRYFGLFNPNVTLASVIGETLVAMYNPQLANWQTSPAANEIERHTLSWLIAKFGLPPESMGTFTSGGTEANLSAVIAALTWAFPEYGEYGLRRLAAAPTIYLTNEAHHGYNKIAHMTGLGRNALRIVAIDRDLKLDVADLERKVKEDRKNGLAPFMVIGTGGTTAAGIIDPLEEIGQFCRRERLWFHADAAWGGAAVVSPALRHYMAGIETADSITCDAHKWFSVPMGCGMFFCRHPETVLEAFRTDVSYLPGKALNSADLHTTFDPRAASIQWSRRFIGLRLFMALANLGESGQAAMLEHQTRLGNLLREALLDSGWRIVNQTPLPLVCFTRDGLIPSELLATLRERRVVWMSEAKIGSVPVLRACITNFKTTEADVHAVVEELNRLFHQNTGASGTRPEAAAPTVQERIIS